MPGTMLVPVQHYLNPGGHLKPGAYSGPLGTGHRMEYPSFDGIEEPHIQPCLFFISSGPGQSLPEVGGFGDHGCLWTARS